MKRIKTEYPGVFYREVKRSGGKGIERVYYAVYKKDGKTIEAKLGKQYQDDLTPARANQKRTSLIEGRELTPQDKRKAEKAAHEAEAGIWTISKLWDEYCKLHPDNKVLAHDKSKFNLYLREPLGTRQPSSILPLDVDRIRLNLQKAGKRTTSARVLELLRRIINFGVKKGLVPPIGFKIEIPRLNNQTTEDLSQEQVKMLMKVLSTDIDQTAANIMRLALYTGMRRSEILKLKWSDIDFERGFINIRDPKGGRDQTIPMNVLAKGIFDSTRKLNESPFVFPGKDKKEHLTDCRKSFTRIKTAAGLPKDFRPLHGLRHVYASMLASSGQVDLYTLQKLLTHKDAKMTQRYAHLRDDALKRAADVAGALIENTLNKIKEENNGK